jgi:hypothetical protein
VIEKQLVAVALCLALFAHPVLANKFEVSPALPRCKPAGESRTPMPIWSPEVTHEGKLSSAPPEGTGVVYLDLWAENDDVHCAGALDNEYYTFTFPGRTPRDGIEVNIRGPARYVGFGGMCSYSGFYISEWAEHDGERQSTFRPVSKFGVMSSGLYCLGKWRHAAPRPADPPVAPPIASGQEATLPVCKRSGEERVPIPVWAPQMSRNYEDVFSEPPQGDGRIVHISIGLAPGTPCTWYSHDLFSFALPSDPKHRENGGLEVNLRGNATEKNGRCVLEGFYMNEWVPGIQQGWVSTYFGAVDEKAIIQSATYCLAPLENERGGVIQTR